MFACVPHNEDELLMSVVCKVHKSACIQIVQLTLFPTGSLTETAVKPSVILANTAR